MDMGTIISAVVSTLLAVVVGLMSMVLNSLKNEIVKLQDKFEAHMIDAEHRLTTIETTVFCTGYQRKKHAIGKKKARR